MNNVLTTYHYLCASKNPRRSPKGIYSKIMRGALSSATFMPHTPIIHPHTNSLYNHKQHYSSFAIIVLNVEIGHSNSPRRLTMLG